MPQYKVIKPGFFDGAMYSPDHPRRNILRTDSPFPKKKNKEQIPSWLKLIAEESAAQKKSREDLEKDQDKANADKAKDDKAEIESVTFVSGNSGVETL